MIAQSVHILIVIFWSLLSMTLSNDQLPDYYDHDTSGSTPKPMSNGFRYKLYHGTHTTGFTQDTSDDEVSDDWSEEIDDNVNYNKPLSPTLGANTHSWKSNQDDTGDTNLDRKRDHFRFYRRGQSESDRSSPLVWHPLIPPYLTQPNVYIPFFPYTIWTWAHKPNDILLIMLQSQNTQDLDPDTQSSPSNATSPPSSGSLKFGKRDTPKPDGGQNLTQSSSDLHLPSSCIWAIVACCAPQNFHFRYGCFNFLGCSVPFWNEEVCQVPIILEAIQQTLQYYLQLSLLSSNPEIPQEHPSHAGVPQEPPSQSEPDPSPKAGAEDEIPITVRTTTTTSATTPITTTPSTTTTSAPTTTTAAQPEQTVSPEDQ